MPLAAGTRLGAYEIIAPLGRGGMGEVYRARDPRLGRDVAIKALTREFACDPERLARFRREAQTLAALNHPNIAAIYGLEEVDDVPHLILELVEGETLAERLIRAPLPPKDVIVLGVQIAGAIEAAHERGIVHRDLKPGNVMIAGSGVAKVLDFGLAKTDPDPVVIADLNDSPTLTAVPAATLAGVILGTAAYMSPEQARGLPVDRRTDVWSFGCVLYECLTGRPAFDGATVSDRIAKILEREPEWSLLPSLTPPRAREILRRCLRKDAGERPRDIRDVRLELEAIAAGGARADGVPEKSIAVLPFENQSGADDDYFADGVTDEILNALAQVEGLRVAARTSCFAFKGRREDLRRIGETLDVAHVLEGTVRRAGARLRITVQLVNVADGYQLWSERYDREMTDVFAVQDEIAGGIAKRLRGTIDDPAPRIPVRSGTRNLEAYDLLLKGRALQGRRGRFLSAARACFERAIELDPGYAEALAWLSDSYRVMGVFGGAPCTDVMPASKALAERALAIDPELAEAWAVLASIAELYDRDFVKSDTLYERALALDPRHSRARAQRALWRAVRGAMPIEEALAQGRQAVHDDPLNAWAIAMNSYVLGIAGYHEDSIAEAQRAMTVDPDSFFGHWNLMRGYAWAGRNEEAIQEAPALCGMSGRHHWAVGLLGWTYARAGRVAGAEACYNELEARSRHEFVAPSWLSVVAAAANRADESFRWAERAVAERDPLILWSRRLPFWDSMRADSRFAEVMRAVWE
jgi:TolB-like protein